MRRTFFLMLLGCWLNAGGQVTLVLNLPPNGLSIKPQLWNMVLTNGSAPMHCYLELQLTDAATSNPVMTARTVNFSVHPGANVLQANNFSPIQYNVLDPAYQSVAFSEFLPVGNFRACYSLWKQESDRVEKIVEECDLITVEPLSPPLLQYPYHESALETPYPVFNWIPPGPVQLFTGMTYELAVAAIYPGQTENDAIQLNIPLYVQSGITPASWPYPGSAPTLEAGKKYAWRVSVLNNQQVVARTDTWWFSLAETARRDTIKSVLPFLKLKTESEQGYGIVENELKFEYLNETADTTWNVQLFDLSANRQLVGSFLLDSLPLRFGQNFVRLRPSQLEYLDNKHIYLLELRNSRQQIYRLRFEYRRKENQ